MRVASAAVLSILMSNLELFKEMKTFVERLDLKETIFRSDHASNRLVLKGNLGRDKELFLKQIDEAIRVPDNPAIREGYSGGY